MERKISRVLNHCSLKELMVMDLIGRDIQINDGIAEELILGVEYNE